MEAKFLVAKESAEMQQKIQERLVQVCCFHTCQSWKKMR